MSGNVDILLRLLEVATIGRTKLQDYYDQWLKRPIAREFGISHLIVGSDLILTVNLDAGRVEFIGERTFTPICELLDYVIEQHFQDGDQRRALHAQARDIRKRWGRLATTTSGLRHWPRNCPTGRRRSENQLPAVQCHLPGVRSHRFI